MKFQDGKKLLEDDERRGRSLNERLKW